MSKMSDFISKNKDLVYSLAEKNTPHNTDNKVVVLKDDEWLNEKEWEKLYQDMVVK